MSTFLHGIGTVQFLDKSAEMVDLKGIDISSLDKTGVINYEHKSDIPAQLVGKILKAKKIFSKEDCSDEHQTYFWNKVKTPYVYIMAELLDDYCDSAKHVAGILRYDRDKKHQNAYNIAWFSVEGSEIPNTRKGPIITRAIARKVTLTTAPCNASCAVEILENQKPEIKDDFESIFKSEEEAVTLFKSGEGKKIYEDFLAKKESMQKDDNPDMSVPPPEPNKANAAAMQAGATAPGPSMGDAISNIKQGLFGKKEKKCDLHKSINSPVRHGAGSVGGWNASIGEHKQLGNVVTFQHPQHGTVTVHKDKPTGAFHVKHNGNFAGMMGKKGIFNNANDAVAHAKNYVKGVSAGKVVGRVMVNAPSNPNSKVEKSLTAGSTNAAPSTLVNGSAYQVESMGSKPASTGAENHKFQGTKKKDWNKQAKDDYERWPHKEKFESFMKARMPHLADGEIRAIGRAIALKKSIDFEKTLKSLVLKK